MITDERLADESRTFKRTKAALQQMLDKGPYDHYSDTAVRNAIMAIDELLSLRRAQWQPIESAPKGGGAESTTDPKWVKPPLILLRFPWREDHCVARWDWYYAEGGIGHEPRFGPHGAWIEPVSGERVVLHYDPPSHWMPLPPPPKDSESL